MAFAELEDSLDLKIFEGESIDPPNFVKPIAERVGRVQKAVVVLTNSVVEAKANEGLRFAEGFLHCRHQIEAAGVIKRLSGLDALQVDDPDEESLFEWGRAGRRLGERFPYEILPGSNALKEDV